MRLRIIIGTTIALTIGVLVGSFASAPAHEHHAGRSIASIAVEASHQTDTTASIPVTTAPLPAGFPILPPDADPPAEAQSPQQDQMAYAYASTDLATLATDLASVNDAAAALSGVADPATAHAAGARLEAVALTMAADAGNASARMQPRNPSDPSLAQLRSDALSAYALIADYAQAARDLAAYATSLDRGAASTAMASITALQRGGGDLLGSFDTIGGELEIWAAANAQAAAAALSRFA